MGLAISIIDILNTLIPNIASLVVLVKKKDNTIAVVTLLDEADTQFDANIKQAIDWLAVHPKVA